MPARLDYITVVLKFHTECRAAYFCKTDSSQAGSLVRGLQPCWTTAALKEGRKRLPLNTGVKTKGSDTNHDPTHTIHNLQNTKPHMKLLLVHLQQ